MTCRKELKFRCDCAIEDIYTHFELNNKIGIFRVFCVDRDENRIILVHRPDFRSNGEKVILTLKESINGSADILAVSESFTFLRLFDWGRNETNLSILESYLTKLAQIINPLEPVEKSL